MCSSLLLDYDATALRLSHILHLHMSYMYTSDFFTIIFCWCINVEMSPLFLFTSVASTVYKLFILPHKRKKNHHV